MPELSPSDAAKLLALEDILRAGQKLRVAELVKAYFPDPDGALWFAFTQIDQVRGFEAISSFAEVRSRILTSKSTPFLDIPKTTAISDDAVDLTFSDIDGELSRLCYAYGQGIKVEIYSYYPDVDLRLLEFTGNLRAPKDANGITLKVQVASGFRSAKLLLPHRLPIPGCMFIFGALLSSLEEVALHKGCPYNIHVGGSVGVPGFTDCPRDSVTSCQARLGTPLFFPGFKTIVESLVNFQTKGPNLLATARGNESNLTEPIRAVYGDRLLKDLRLLAYRPENDTNHPDKGWVAALFEIGEGTFNSLTDHRINNTVVGFQHLNSRDGTLGQSRTGFSPNIDPYSGTGVFFGRIQGDFRNVQAGDLSGSVRAQGFKGVRVYSTPTAYVEQYTTSRPDCLLDMLTNKRWGYGEDYARYDIQSFIDARLWCNEFVSVTDPNGNVFSGPRSTFNAELTGRATQTQVEDVCIAGRISPPFEHNGLKMIVPLRRETIDDSKIPYFTDTTSDANICADSKGQPLASWSYVGDDELANQYTVTFDDASNGFISTPLIFGNQRQQLAAGKAWGDTTLRIINKDIPAFGITNFQEAARLGNSLLALGPLDRGGIENNFQVKFTTWFSQCFEVRMFKLVRLRIRALTQLFNALGIPGFEYFRVMGRKRKGNLQYELIVQAYPVDFYDDMETIIDNTGDGAGGGINPGGGPLDIPCRIAFSVLGHTSDTITLGLENC
jgi:hypothetical protein